ncbi:hypothetical protein LZ005_13985 [Massilia sp. TS11]|nr:hypothetical protein [Massilia sp. TS11]
MDVQIKQNVLAVMRLGRDREEAMGFFRVALGLYYLAGLMTDQAIDFKALDKVFNRFIYQTVGKGHSITSILQWMSGAKVLPVIESERFLNAFKTHCPEVSPDLIPFLMAMNLGVAKNISKLEVDGPVAEWIERQKQH